MKKIKEIKDNLGKNIDIKGIENKTKSFWSEFKSFAMKGSVIDLAIGLIIGSAFTSIVTSLTKDIITPVISLLTGGFNYSGLFVSLDGNTYASLAEATEKGAAVLSYGNFINATINFLIVALAIFIIFKKILAPKKKNVVVVPTEKECPYCKSTINVSATRCPHCTSTLE